MITDTLKDLLGEIPVTAELFWFLRQRNMATTAMMDLSRLNDVLPGWCEQVHKHTRAADVPRRVVIFGMVRYWIEYSALLSLAYAGLGHEVTFAYLPYDHWGRAINRFDLRRQNAYTKKILKPLHDFVKVVSLLDVKTQDKVLSEPLCTAMKDRAFYDTQYTQATEFVEESSEAFQLRLSRNMEAGAKLHAWLPDVQPDVVIVPNGSVMEYGVVYELCKHHQIPVVTFEFGEQNRRIWIAQNDDVMLQDTTAMWSARGRLPLKDEERSVVEEMFASRQGAKLWKTFARQWQGVPAQGEESIRKQLGLDERPIAFLATNVLGDSLTLRRQIFTGISEWIDRTVHYFADHPEFQLVVRIHPGEKLSWGPSAYKLVENSFPILPENVHVIRADEKVNSYDLIAAADLGMVYTTTMGLEMAMSGLPVVVVGKTHYRGKGFTLDPSNWEEYFQILGEKLTQQSNEDQAKNNYDLAWRYAYRFFFEYALPFPWHLHFYWDALNEVSLAYVLSDAHLAGAGRTFEYLLGAPIDWDNPVISKPINVEQ